MGFGVQTFLDVKMRVGHKQGILYNIATKLWDCTLSPNTLLFLQRTTNNLTKETRSLSNARTSDRVLVLSEFVPNFEQIFSPSIHLGYRDFRNKHGVSQQTA